jgi:hypothetical protein
MTDPISILNIGELSKPATILIEKISDAIGGLYRPRQIRRIARAEADAEKIKALAEIETTELQRRALQRFLSEEAIKQDNMESITTKAIPLLEEGAAPKDVDNDWIAAFFDKCRLVSDNEMQDLWAALLAGEANNPNTHSKRTLSLLASLDNKDAVLLETLCRFAWLTGGGITPIVLNPEDPLYNGLGITFQALAHLDSLGILRFDNLTGFLIKGNKKKSFAYYGETRVDIEFKEQNNNTLPIGKVLLTNVGKELALLCTHEPVAEYLDHIADYWRGKGLSVSISGKDTAG